MIVWTDEAARASYEMLERLTNDIRQKIVEDYKPANPSKMDQAQLEARLELCRRDIASATQPYVVQMVDLYSRFTSPQIVVSNAGAAHFVRTDPDREAE